jgi:CMP-2-keto-3-deoxyoctulosonic acid synthetase
MLVGIKTAGQLGGREELLDAYAHFLTTVIYPMQSDILKTFESIFKVNGVETTLGVEQTRLFDDGEKIDVVTSVEAEAGEDTILETKAEGVVE